MKKIKRILIANRGEIALRIIRACKDLSIETVQVFSEADADTIPVKLADRSICIGPAPSNLSYLNPSAIITAALLLDVDAIHPGYGFLSENSSFASICEDYGIKFIGPNSSMLKLIKNKANVRKIAKEVGVPILPGTLDPIEDEMEARMIASEIDYPILLKAAMGGGGRGIRKVSNQEELDELFALAKRESFTAFGSDEIYIEKCLSNPRHVEVQILGDGKGEVVHLGVRECSIQRKHQKIIEEAPTLALNSNQIENLTRTAVKLAKALNYENAGTFEFLSDDVGNFYFMEVNARIQVEHPITEETTGIDIVKEQIKIAENGNLSIRQEDVKQKGWAFEFRINAEDPGTFTPQAGKVDFLHFPLGPNIRIDSHIYCGYMIPPFYDSLLSKLIIHGPSRENCIHTAKRALEEFTIEGIKTNIPLLLKIVNDKDFLDAKISTSYLEKFTNISII
ncbi:MAG TPA: acetyl-CoA carboxylase biotin carboxylase subunit [Caldisericia bacterium]|nr:acetyl-CoA carboxylase biotin carboxylase subunit [Caldisericia bacterium]